MGSKKEHENIFISACGSFAQEAPVAPLLRHSAAEAIDAISESERVDPRCQSRQLARDRVLVENALGYRPMELGLREPEGRLCSRLVARCDRRLDLFHKGAHAAHAGAIDRRALGCLPDALFR